MSVFRERMKLIEEFIRVIGQEQKEKKGNNNLFNNLIIAIKNHELNNEKTQLTVVNLETHVFIGGLETLYPTRAEIDKASEVADIDLKSKHKFKAEINEQKKDTDKRFDTSDDESVIDDSSERFCQIHTEIKEPCPACMYQTWQKEIEQERFKPDPTYWDSIFALLDEF